MAINLLNIQPHKVSRDLSGYIVTLFGDPKIGKTTFGTKMPDYLLLAFERGYNALPGVIAQDVQTWGELKQVLRELKKPEVKERYKSIVIDTIDIASEMCQKYVCNQLGIENIGDGGWSTNGWAKYKKELEETFRSLAQMGYAILFLSHAKEKTIKPQNGAEYQQICSSMQSSAMAIIEGMSDIITYAHPVVMPDGTTKRILTLRSGDNSVRCGSRFRHMVNQTDFTYEALTKALNDAIDKEANETGGAFVTEERQQVKEQTQYDFDALMTEFQDIVSKVMQINQSNAPKLTAIVDKYLGKGKKVGDATPDQAELIYLIITEIKADLMPGN